MTKVMRQLGRVGAWKIARNLLHILINNVIFTSKPQDGGEESYRIYMTYKV